MTVIFIIGTIEAWAKTDYIETVTTDSNVCVISEGVKGSTGKLSCRQAFRPPANGRTRLIPLRRSRNVISAAVTSLGQLQYKTTSWSRGIS
jgi:hypothetical protein